MALPQRIVPMEQPKRHKSQRSTLNAVLHSQTTPTLHWHSTIKLQPRANKGLPIHPPTTTIPLCHININECNPENDIAHTQSTIQSQHGVSHIYDNIGRHLITFF